MNTQEDLSRRLLKLYPVKLIKDHFNSDLFGENMYNEILRNNIKTVIDDFAYVNLDNTKQHIYIFNSITSTNFLSTNLDDFPFNIVTDRIINNERHIVISPKIRYQSYVTNPFETITLKFHQPIKIVISESNIIFYVTILEKNINCYFDISRKVLDVSKLDDELNIIISVNEMFNFLRPVRCDLNKGIKFLWHNDIVDSKYAKWKKDKSTTTETMDENYTLKSQYPDVYDTIVNAPLQKTVFKYLPDDGNLPEHFTLDPAIGLISIPLFPKHINQNYNVVREILSNNR